MSHDQSKSTLNRLIEIITRNIGLCQEDLDLDEPLERYGTDSMQWANIAYELSATFDRHFTPEEIAAAQSVNGIAAACNRS